MMRLDLDSSLIFTIFAELIGTCVFAHTAAVLSAIIMDSKLDPSIAEYNKQMPRIKEYLRKAHVEDGRAWVPEDGIMKMIGAGVLQPLLRDHGHLFLIKCTCL